MGGGLSVLTSLPGDDLPEVDPSVCKHKFCEKWGPGHYHCCDCHTTVTDPDLISQEDRIIETIVDKSVPEDGVYRGVSIQFLFDFANACNCWDMTTRDVRRRFVMPATRASRCRFVELPEMSSVVGKATIFVSHTWGAKFGDLVAAVCDGNADRSRIVWVDIFAVRQWSSHKPDLDFSAVVKQCKALMVVCSSLSELVDLDSVAATQRKTDTIPSHVRAQVAFLRVWCLVEIHAAILNDVVIVMKGGSFSLDDGIVKFNNNEKMLKNMMLFIDVETAEATVPSDKQRILNDINGSVGGVAALNETVRSLLSGASYAADQPLIVCAACGDENAVAEILNNPSSYVEQVAGCGFTSLLRQCLDRGCDVTGNNTSLIAAARGGHVACVELLISSGANITAEDANRLNAADAAAISGHVEIIQILIDNGYKFDWSSETDIKKFFMATVMGHAACVELFLRLGYDVNARNDVGGTALIGAAIGGHIACVETLLNHGADVTLTMRDFTARMFAEAYRHTACVALLKEWEEKKK